MPQRDPVVNIQRLYDQVKDVAVVCYVIIWESGHNGSLWVHPIAVINILTKYGNFNKTIQTIYGEVVPVTVSWYGCLLEVDDG